MTPTAARLCRQLGFALDRLQYGNATREEVERFWQALKKEMECVAPDADT